MRKIAIFLVMMALLLVKTPKAVMAAGALQCSWDTKSNGNFSFCVGGFETEDEAVGHHYLFKCTKNCGGSGLRGWWYSLFGGDEVAITKAGTARDPKNPNTYYSCVQMQGGQFSTDIDNVIDNCMRPHFLAKLQAAGCGTQIGDIFWRMTGAGAVVTIPGDIHCAIDANNTDIYNKTFQECMPEFTGQVNRNSDFYGVQGTCEAPLPTSMAIGGLTQLINTPFELCSQIDEHDTDAVGKCEHCIADNDNPQGMWTAIGCIPTAPTSIIQTLIKLALGIGGGITLLLILAGAFRLSVSQGDPKQAEEAKEQITSAVIGLLFIIFSIVMLRFVGIQVLHIPGFGG